jgi:hypothetical protein
VVGLWRAREISFRAGCLTRKGITGCDYFGLGETIDTSLRVLLLVVCSLRPASVNR